MPVGLMGFGRIGRNVFRQLAGDAQIAVGAIVSAWPSTTSCFPSKKSWESGPNSPGGTCSPGFWRNDSPLHRGWRFWRSKPDVWGCTSPRLARCEYVERRENVIAIHRGAGGTSDHCPHGDGRQDRLHRPLPIFLN